MGSNAVEKIASMFAAQGLIGSYLKKKMNSVNGVLWGSSKVRRVRLTIEKFLIFLSIMKIFKCHL